MAIPMYHRVESWMTLLKGLRNGLSVDPKAYAGKCPVCPGCHSIFLPRPPHSPTSNPELCRRCDGIVSSRAALSQEAVYQPSV